MNQTNAPGIDPPSHKGRLIAIAMVGGGGLIFGGLATANKLAIGGGIPWLAYAFWQMVLGGSITLALALIIGVRIRFELQYLKFYLFSGVCVGLPFALLAYVSPNIPAGVLTLVFLLSLPYTYVMALIARLDNLTWINVLGIVLMFFGVLTLIAPETSLPDPSIVWWVLLAMLAPLGFATVNIHAALSRPVQAPSLLLAAGLMFGAAVILLPFMLATKSFYSPAATTDLGNVALIAASMINVLVMFLFYEIVRHVGPVFFPLINFFAVPAGLFWGYLFFSEIHSGWVWFAILLLLVGLIVLNEGLRRSRQMGEASAEVGAA